MIRMRGLWRLFSVNPDSGVPSAVLDNVLSTAFIPPLIRAMGVLAGGIAGALGTRKDFLGEEISQVDEFPPWLPSRRANSF